MRITREIVEQYKNGDIVWDEAHIEERTKRMYQEVLEIWPSFREKLDEKKESEKESTLKEPELDKYSEEELADPLKLLEAVKS